MNYRHAYHAGNFADVMKHALLVRILEHLRRKETAFRVIDTHAGPGLYDLAGVEAGKTGEWEAGIGRLAEPFAPEVEALLAPYRAAIAEVQARFGASLYPGSPLISLALLRPQDRAIFVEKHPEDGATLAARCNAGPSKVLRLDGWTALHGLIPPKERRGLVLIDPPYEERDELQRLGVELQRAWRKWPNGIYAAWYPIKAIAPIDDLAKAIAGTIEAPALRLELMVQSLEEPDRLNGSGLLVLNPPWTLAAEAEILLPALAQRLAREGYGAFRCDWIREPA